MKELVFDSGVVSYSLNGKCEVSFNPADHAFAERFYSAVDEMGKLQDEYAKKAEALQEPGVLTGSGSGCGDGKGLGRPLRRACL